MGSLADDERLATQSEVEDALDCHIVAAQGRRGSVNVPKVKRALLQRHTLGPLRIGSGKGGATEVRAHQWFRGFNFEALNSDAMPAPYVPNLRGNEDDANFGPLDWRGEPVLTSPEYDVKSWEALWDEGEWHGEW